MVCHNRRRRRGQATVQLAPLHSWHRRVRRDRRTTAVGAIAAAIAIRACRGIIAAAASRGSGEGGSRGGGGGLQGRQRRERAEQVGFECSNASDGRTGHRCRTNLDGALQILVTWPFRPHRSQWSPEPSDEGGDSSWGHPPALVPPSNGPPRPKFAVSGFGGGRGCYCCYWQLTWWLPPPRDQDCFIPRPLPLVLPPPLFGPPYPPRLVWNPPLATSACGLGVTPDDDRCSS